MPAAEAELSIAPEDDRARYELAFHVLPTVAEGEVSTIVADIKAMIEKAGGEIFAAENPERIDLAYEVVEHVEGKHRKFKSAYFGWVRFALPPESIERVSSEVDSTGSILRYLVIRLTKIEEASPFYYHQAMRDQKQVTSVEESEILPDTTTVRHDAEAEVERKEEGGEVDEAEIEKALQKPEV